MSSGDKLSDEEAVEGCDQSIGFVRPHPSAFFATTKTASPWWPPQCTKDGVLIYFNVEGCQENYC